MWMVKVLLLTVASLALAWNPVRPGALVRKVGQLMIVDESIRVILNFSNVTHITYALNNIDKGMKLIKVQLDSTTVGTSLQSKMLVKYEMVMKKLENLKGNFVENNSRTKRAIVTGSIIVGALLAVTGVGLYADLSSKVKTLEKQIDKIEYLQLTLNDVTTTVTEITEALEDLHDRHVKLHTSMDIYMLLDQISIKLTELQSEIKIFIQDLVLANSGQVTSTLLSIPQFINILDDAQNYWNFNPFFSSETLSLYYPLLNSYLNGSSVVIDIPFLSEFQYELYEIMPFPMLVNDSIYLVETTMV